MTSISAHGRIVLRVQDELAELDTQLAEGRAAIAQLEQRLAALASEQRARAANLQAAFEAREVARRQVEQQITFVEMATETPAAEAAQAELGARLQALEEAETRYRTIAQQCDDQTATDSEEHARLDAARREGQVIVVGLQGRRDTLAEVLNLARSTEGKEILEALTHQATLLEAQRAEAQRSAEECTAALGALAARAKAQLAAWPDALLTWQSRFLPVDDPVTQRLEAGIAYRRALLSWVMGRPDDYTLNMPIRWFQPQQAEWASAPERMGEEIRAMQQALARHVEEARKQAR